MRYVKKILVAAVVLFALFYVVSRPEDSASAVRGVLDAIVNGVGSLFTFFESLVG
ncbi:hypothetical protein ACQBAU_08600 [Propionibacteriaceae bacterium Y2011]|uniref:hypothetical protein n=1 Tax=Microlunatus sp. Y2014 TaxID=3418488 RepID=UPI003B4BB559